MTDTLKIPADHSQELIVTHNQMNILRYALGLNYPRYRNAGPVVRNHYFCNPRDPNWADVQALLKAGLLTPGRRTGDRDLSQSCLHVTEAGRIVAEAVRYKKETKNEK